MKSVLQQIKRYNGNTVFEEGQSFKIVLPSTRQVNNHTVQHANSPEIQSEMTLGNKYTITVKKYMTEQASVTFDFMSKFNNNIPMPMVTMTGTIEKETRGMYFMNLEGTVKKDGTFSNCLCCGRTLTNPISIYYGIGPECGKHFYINPFDSEEELKSHLGEVRKQIRDIKWSGWVIKSSIKNFEEV